MCSRAQYTDLTIMVGTRPCGQMRILFGSVIKIWYIRLLKPCLVVFPQACLCKRVVLVLFVASVHARAFWKHVFDLLLFVFSRS